MQAKEESGSRREELKNTGPLGKVWPMGPWKLEEKYEKGVG